jgi:Winged helix DNA-binding domain
VSVAAERFAAQLLTGRSATSPEQVAQRLLAIQAQDNRSARLTIRSRSTGLHSSDVDRALTERSLVVSWLNRGTLHLVRAEDYWWLHDLTTPQLATGSLRRLSQEGVPSQDAERAVALIVKALAGGPMTRPQLRKVVAAAGIRTEGQAMVHVLFLATLRGLVVRGPMVGAEQAFVLVRDWLGTPAPARDRAEALAELGRRYLAGHGPADDRDLAKWAGITLGDARTALKGTAHVQRDDGLVELKGSQRTDALPPPRLLGAFEPVLLGWVSRDEILGGDKTLVTNNGIFRPFAMVGGVAVASWGFPGGAVCVTPFRPLSKDITAALSAEAAGIEQFLTAKKGSA